MRIASLLPSSTDILSALKCEGQLVGRSHEVRWVHITYFRVDLFTEHSSLLRHLFQIITCCLIVVFVLFRCTCMQCDAPDTTSASVCTEPKLGPTGFSLSHADIHAAVSALHTNAAWQLVDVSHSLALEASIQETAHIHKPQSLEHRDHIDPAGGVPPAAAIIVEWFLAPYRVLTSILRAVRPDIILTQFQDEPGVLDRKTIEFALQKLLGYQPVVVHLDPQSLQDAFGDMQRIAAAVGCPDRGKQLVASMHQQISTVQKMCSGRQPRRVLCVQWLDPIFTAGAWVPELIKLAGGVTETNGQMMKAEEFRDALPRCEKLLFAVCGSGISESMEAVRREEVVKLSLQLHHTRRGQQEVGDREGGSSPYSARGELQMTVMEASRHFSRFGPTLVDSLEILAEVLHEEIQSFGHQGKLWVDYKAC